MYLRSLAFGYQITITWKTDLTASGKLGKITLPRNKKQVIFPFSLFFISEK